MQILILVLRIIHILAGVFWAGATWLLAGWVTPAVELSGPAGQTFMQTLVRKRRLSDWLTIAALLSILSGLYLFWVASSGLRPGWFRTGLGLSLTIGALAGMVTFLIAMAVNRPSATRLSELAASAQASGGPPDPEIVAEMEMLSERLDRAGMWASGLLALSVLGMAAAERLWF